MTQRGVRLSALARRDRRITRSAIALFVAVALSIALPLGWYSTRPGERWTPTTGTPDEIREAVLTFEDGGWLHVVLALEAEHKRVAVGDALLRVRIAPTSGHDEAVRLEARVGAQHFRRHGDEAILDVEFPCNLRGRIPRGTSCLEATVAVVVSDPAPMEATTKFSITPSSVEPMTESARR
jgi:hypothetical protein